MNADEARSVKRRTGPGSLSVMHQCLWGGGIKLTLRDPEREPSGNVPGDRNTWEMSVELAVGIVGFDRSSSSGSLAMRGLSYNCKVPFQW